MEEIFVEIFQSCETEQFGRGRGLFFGSEQWLLDSGTLPEPKSWSHDSGTISKVFTAIIGAGAFFGLRSSGAFVHAHVINK